MPKLTNRVPKYCRHKASGQAVVTFQGKDYYLGKWKSRESAGIQASARPLASPPMRGGARNTPERADRDRARCGILDVRQGLLRQERQAG